ncbi:MAG: type II toxin-antitoxin system prevent-host-death family antitoxin [Janthinobacterium lividum]
MTVRELRNDGGAVLDEVARGEVVVVTRDGAEVAELHPRGRRGLSAAELVRRWRAVPPVDPDRLRRDIDEVSTRRYDKSRPFDTSTVVFLSCLNDPELLPDEPLISTITPAELSVKPFVATGERERASRQAVLQQAEASFVPLDFDAAAARAFGRVPTALRRAGRKPSARGFDALIATVAISRNIPVYTCNPAGFAMIDDLDVRPVPHPDNSAR